jgi:hypothetical protein
MSTPKIPCQNVTEIQFTVARKPHKNGRIAIKAKISLPFTPIFDEMTTSFLIKRFGSVDVSAGALPLVALLNAANKF